MTRLHTVLLACCFLLAPLLSPVPSEADRIAREQVDALAFQMGIDPDMESYEQDPVLGSTRFTGTVVAPCRMESLGFMNVREGDSVEVICQDTGMWLGRNLDTGEEKTFKLTIDWGKKD